MVQILSGKLLLLLHSQMTIYKILIDTGGFQIYLAAFMHTCVTKTKVVLNFDDRSRRTSEEVGLWQFWRTPLPLFALVHKDL